jgi:hypothetical protein
VGLAAAEMIRAAGHNVSLELIGCGGVTEMPASYLGITNKHGWVGTTKLRALHVWSLGNLLDFTPVTLLAPLSWCRAVQPTALRPTQLAMLTAAAPDATATLETA